MSKPVYGYMCKTDFDWELGEAMGGTTVYPSIGDLKENRKCVDQCGIVRVLITLEEVIEERKPWRQEDSNEKK